MKHVNQTVKIAPSMLSADFTNLERDIHLVEEGGADWLHLDIMDGHFVPNITFGPMVVKAIRSLTKLPLDAHLMIAAPDRYLEVFRDAGVDRLTVHVETCPQLHRTIQRIQELGMKAGVTLNPSTPVSTIEEIVPSADLVLVMTVNPGFSGQQFIPTMLRKIEEVSRLISSSDRPIELEVDGGVDINNARDIVKAGATVLVAGNSIFGKKSIPQSIRLLRTAAQS